ncbi:hypothetical protein [Streptomyces fagopyri]|uniref:hypothetical protein n=1 Tax=Streptomyces fagopyri TaxID=2662397 RepID=UPI0033F97608
MACRQLHHPLVQGTARQLVLLRVRDGVLVAHMLKWGDEVRDPADLAPKEPEVTDSEIDEAVHLIDSMTTDDTSGYRDTYREALEAVIEAKAEGRQPPEPRTAEEGNGGKVVDLMAALQESVRKAQSARGEGSGNAEIHEMPESKTKPKKKTTATKTAKQAPAKKASAKKAAKKPARRGEFPVAAGCLRASCRGHAGKGRRLRNGR